MAGNVYFTADLHLGHAKIAALRGFDSMEKHDDWVIEQLASTAKSSRDVLWILGDIAFGKHNLVRLHEVPAMKKLVLGNHDAYSIDNYSSIAQKIYGAFVYKGCVLLTHIPVSDQQKQRFSMNVHGHLHRNYLEDPWYLNVCVEWGIPFHADEIMDSIPEKENPDLLQPGRVVE